MNIRVKMLMRYRHSILVFKARKFNLNTCGTKCELAARIAEYELKKFRDAWKAISKP